MMEEKARAIELLDAGLIFAPLFLALFLSYIHFSKHKQYPKPEDFISIYFRHSFEGYVASVYLIGIYWLPDIIEESEYFHHFVALVCIDIIFRSFYSIKKLQNQKKESIWIRFTNLFR